MLLLLLVLCTMVHNVYSGCDHANATGEESTACCCCEKPPQTTEQKLQEFDQFRQNLKGDERTILFDGWAAKLNGALAPPNLRVGLYWHEEDKKANAEGYHVLSKAKFSQLKYGDGKNLYIFDFTKEKFPAFKEGRLTFVMGEQFPSIMFFKGGDVKSKLIQASAPRVPLITKIVFSQLNLAQPKPYHLINVNELLNDEESRVYLIEDPEEDANKTPKTYDFKFAMDELDFGEEK